MSVTLRQPETRNFDQAYVAARSDDACRLQPLKVRFAHPEPAEDFSVVLAELGRDGTNSHRFADFDRGADVRDLAQFRVARILNEAAVAHLWVGKHLRVIVDRATRHAGASSTSTQWSVVLVVSTAFITSSNASRFAMRCWLVTKRGSSRHSGCPRASAQRPDRLADGTHHQIAVLGLHALIGRVLAMARTLAGGLLTVGEPLRRGP